jgi:hypothetical protein
MAIGTPTAFITAFASGTDLDEYTTSGTGAPTANALGLVGVMYRAATAGDFAKPTLAGGGMAAWDEVDHVQWGTVASPRNGVTVFRAQEASPGAAAALVATFGVGNTQSRCWIFSIQYTGVAIGNNGADAITQTKTELDDGTGLSLTITLDNAISSGGATGGFFHYNGNATAAAGSGYTLLGNNLTESARATHEYRLDGSTTVDMSWDINANSRGGVAYEIAVAAGGAVVGQSTSQRSTRRRRR